jgi:hypothetical protein
VGPAYMPRVFPRGEWRITGVEWTRARDFAPVKIKTDAWQSVRVWALDAKGGMTTRRRSLWKTGGVSPALGGVQSDDAGVRASRRRHGRAGAAARGHGARGAGRGGCCNAGGCVKPVARCLRALG